MEVKGGLVPITAEELLSVTTQCLYNIKNYSGEDDVVHEETYFSFLKMKRVTKKYSVVPTWMYTHCGIVTRLQELQDVAIHVENNKCPVKGDSIYLTITTHKELYNLLNKSDSFQAYVFGVGY